MKKSVKLAGAGMLSVALAGCGTLTGIPGHGGGKRFAEEQRLVSASIRGSLEAIDVSALQGRRVALIFSIIADEGGGNIVGGRASLGALLTGGTMVSPVTTRNNDLEIYQLAGLTNSQANTISAGTGTNVTQVEIAGSNQTVTAQVTDGPTVTTSDGTQVNSGGTIQTTTTSPQTTTSTDSSGVTTTTTTNSDPNQTTSVTTTGGTVTTQDVNNPGVTSTTGTVTNPGFPK